MPPHSRKSKPSGNNLLEMEEDNNPLKRRKSGMSLVESAIEGSRARLRPILMTSFAFIFGLVPLLLSTGAGAIGNKSIGAGAVGGMLVGTILGLLVIPILFIIFQSIQERFSGAPKASEA